MRWRRIATPDPWAAEKLSKPRPRGAATLAAPRPGCSLSLLGRLGRGCRAHPGIVQVDVEAERAHFLDQHVEGFGDAGLERVVATHDRLVHLGTAGDVVRFHGQHFLERVRRAVSLERPHFHFAETLATE